MNLLRFVGAALEKASVAPLEVTPERCARLRAKQSTCDRCVRACPPEAIRIGSEIAVDPERCTGCGICCATCPNDVFAHREWARGQFLAQITQRMAEAWPVTVACSRVPAAEATRFLRVPCLGLLDTATLLNLFAQGALRVELVEPPCESCPSHRGREVVGKAIQDTERWLAVYPHQGSIEFIPVPASASDTTSPAPETALSRRGFLSRFRTRIREATAATLPALKVAVSKEPPENSIAPSIPWSRTAWLFRALHRLGFPLEAPVDLQGLAAQLEIGEGCEGCGLCARFCPLDALRQTRTASNLRLEFQPQRCGRCDLCVEICPPQVLRYAETVDLARGLEPSPQPLWQGELRRCAECRTEFLATAGEKVCCACSNRAQVANYLLRSRD